MDVRPRYPLEHMAFEDEYKDHSEEYKERETDSKKKITYNFVTHNKKKYKPYFRLKPPVKGYGKKGIKLHFKNGGALGYRADKINDLLKRMMM